LTSLNKDDSVKSGKKLAQFLFVIPRSMSTKRTYQPNKRRAQKKHGFLKRMSTEDGRNVLKSRRDKGRKVLSK